VPKIIKRVIIRPRYVKAERFALAPLPSQPIEQGMVGPGLLAQILVSKYEYHQPLYRQEKMFRAGPAGSRGKRVPPTGRASRLKRKTEIIRANTSPDLSMPCIAK